MKRKLLIHFECPGKRKDPGIRLGGLVLDTRGRSDELLDTNLCDFHTEAQSEFFKVAREWNSWSCQVNSMRQEGRLRYPEETPGFQTLLDGRIWESVTVMTGFWLRGWTPKKRALRFAGVKVFSWWADMGNERPVRHAEMSEWWRTVEKSDRKSETSARTRLYKSGCLENTIRPSTEPCGTPVGARSRPCCGQLKTRRTLGWVYN